ncbi:hypothetical protein EI94DRAFT_1803235 [Lactarius quietus]|nr:hypothetical protein EI94DRAFT_1803235 [Lactarius quietus]
MSNRDTDDDVHMSLEVGGNTPHHQTGAGKCLVAAWPSLDELEVQRLCIDDPLACGPCRENRCKCKDLAEKATACTSCAALKIKCDQPKRAGNVSSAPKARARKCSALVVEDQRETLETLQNNDAKLWEVLYSIEQMLHDLCIKANISPPPPVQHCIPQAPPLYESPAANPSSASIESTMLSMLSSLHLNMLTIYSPAVSTGVQPVAGPSRLSLEQMQHAASGTGQCSRSGQRGGGVAKAPTRAPSAAASHWSSHTHG